MECRRFITWPERPLDRSELGRANRDIARALAEACSRCPQPPTLVHVSSLAASGPSTSDRPRSSSDRPEPVSAYGRSKLAGELAVLEFASKLPITILRPVLVFGPREAEISRLYPLIRSGVHPVAGYHKPLLTFLHVEDLITALVHASQYGSRCAGPHPESAEGEAFTM